VQRFPATYAKYAYSPEHASIGTVEAGERFEVESVEGWSGYFRAPSDFTPERHAEAEARKWAVTGPISVEGATQGGAVAVTIHEVKVVTPGVVVYGAYTAANPFEWWDDETACELFPAQNGVLRFDDRTTLPTRPLIGCLAVAPEEGQVHAMLQGRYGGTSIAASYTLRPPSSCLLPTTEAGSTSETARRSWATARSWRRPRSAR
jgi:acetamidase/formamidase